jgi:hypothetical protein
MAGMRAAWWKRFTQRCRSLHVSGRVNASDMVPESLTKREVVLVGNPGNETWAVFDCPCRKGHRLMLNLHKERHPLWRIACYKPLSIWPSIHATTRGRECHFFLKSGRVIWVPLSRPRWWPSRQIIMTTRSTLAQHPSSTSADPYVPGASGVEGHHPVESSPRNDTSHV